MSTAAAESATTGGENSRYALLVSHASKALGVRSMLRDVSLRVARGSIHALLGPNGCGKTTLLRIIAGIWQPDSGAIEHLHGDRAQIGYCAQRFGLYEELTVRENLTFQARMRGCGAEAIDAAEEQFSLRVLQDKRAGTLSGGQRQRLLLAAALLHRPRLLLLDEPTTALDSDSRLALWAILRREVETGTAIILTTHEAADARECHSLTQLQDGVVVGERAAA